MSRERLLSDQAHVCVKISVAMAHQKFCDCVPSHIKDNCLGVCCRNSKGILNVTVHESERKRIESLGGAIVNGFLQSNKSGIWCPFQKENGLCIIHKHKPLGCAASPFKLNKNDTLIVRHRYLAMKCHKEGTIPAYKVFRKSLVVIFGERQTKTIEKKLDAKSGDVFAMMSRSIHTILQSNSTLRRTRGST